MTREPLTINRSSAAQQTLQQGRQHVVDDLTHRHRNAAQMPEPQDQLWPQFAVLAAVVLEEVAAPAAAERLGAG